MSVTAIAPAVSDKKNERVFPGGITESQLLAVTRPFESAQVLPPHCYTEPDFYKFEVEKVMMRQWHLAGRIDQIANPGDYFTITRFGEPAIVLRDFNGDVRAMSAACRHRGFPVASGSGNCGKKGFNCPYHGWRYRPDGSLAAAPYMQEGFDPSVWRLPEFGVDIWQGFIFINFDKDAPLLSPQLKTLDAVMAPFGVEKMKMSRMREKAWPGNWKATLDNFTEAYHQPFIHPMTFEPMAPARKGVYDDVDGPYNLFWMPTPKDEEVHTFWEHVPGLPDRYKRNFIVVNVFPMFHMLIDPSCLVLLDMHVHSHDRLTAKWEALVTEEVFNLPDFEARRDQLTEALIPTWNEDEDACENVRRGQASRFADQGHFSWMEKSVYQLHKWMAQQYLAADV